MGRLENAFRAQPYFPVVFLLAVASRECRYRFSSLFEILAGGEPQYVVVC